MCAAPQALGKNLIGHTIVLKFDSGWYRGVIRNTTKKAGFNYVVQWQGEDEHRHQLLSLDRYGMSCDAPLYSWCVVASAQVDWDAGGAKKKRRTG